MNIVVKLSLYIDEAQNHKFVSAGFTVYKTSHSLYLYTPVLDKDKLHKNDVTWNKGKYIMGMRNTYTCSIVVGSPTSPPSPIVRVS